jgi:hypothetical protein
MLSDRRLLSGLIGLSMIAVPCRAIAANHPYTSSIANRSSIAEPAWQQAKNPVVTLARDDDEDKDEEHEHHHHWWKHHDHDRDDYYWGGRNRYDYPPSYFSAPEPHGWDAPRRRTYWERRRKVAIRLRRQALSRGDTDAAQRLDRVIEELNQRVRRY